MTDKQRKNLIGTPDDDISKLLKEFNSEEAIKKMKENDIDDRQFWDLTQDDIKDLLDIQIYGRLQKLMKKVNNIKKQHQKNMEKQHPELK